MSKTLKKYKINYILFQLVAFTFICIMAFIDGFLNQDFEIVPFGIGPKHYFDFIRIGLWSFTIITIIIYEIYVLLNINKARKKEYIEESVTKVYNEKFLWFEILLLLDVIIIVSLVSKVTIMYNINIIFPLTIGIIIYYFISVISRPYFGIKYKK